MPVLRHLRTQQRSGTPDREMQSDRTKEEMVLLQDVKEVIDEYLNLDASRRELLRSDGEEPCLS